MSLLSGAPVFDEGAFAGLDEEGIHNSNEELLETLRADEHEEELHNIALKDAGLHRMTQPVEATSVELSKVPHLALLLPLFHDCSQQGAHGTPLWCGTGIETRRDCQNKGSRPFLVVLRRRQEEAQANRSEGGFTGALMLLIRLAMPARRPA